MTFDNTKQHKECIPGEKGFLTLQRETETFFRTFLLFRGLNKEEDPGNPFLEVSLN
jgi:hypothetical protein